MKTGDPSHLRTESTTGSLGPNHRITIQSFMDTQLSAQGTTRGGTSSAGKNSIGRRSLSSDQDPVGDNEATDVGFELSELQTIPDIHDDGLLKTEDVWGFFRDHRSRDGVGEAIGNFSLDDQQGKPAEGIADPRPVEENEESDNEKDEKMEEEEHNDSGEEDMARALDSSRRDFYADDRAAGSSRAAASLSTAGKFCLLVSLFRYD